MNGPILFLQARQAPVVVALAGLVSVLAWTLPRELTEVPLRSDVYAPIYLVAVPFAGALCHLCLRRPSATIERKHVRVRVARALWWPVVVAMLIVAAAAPLGWSSDAALACLRNVALFAAVTTLVGLLVPAEWCWLPAAAFAGACLTFGTAETTSHPYDWALALHGPESVLAGSIAIGLTGAAWLGYALFDLASSNTFGTGRAS